MTRPEKIKLFFQQLRGGSSWDIRDAAAATGDVSNIADVITGYAQAHGIDVSEELTGLLAAQEEASGEDKKGKPHFEAIDTGEIKPVTWIVKKIIERGTVVLVFGDSGTGKSFFAVSLAASIITGTSFFEYPVIRPGAVLYIAGEGVSGLSRRFYAWELAHNISLKNAPRTAIPAPRI
jgi:hypothetical protein